MEKIPSHNEYVHKAIPFLIKHGYTILEENWHNEQGNIDIIAKTNDDDKTIHFIKVIETEKGGSFYQKMLDEWESDRNEYGESFDHKYQTIAFEYSMKALSQNGQCAGNMEFNVINIITSENECEIEFHRHGFNESYTEMLEAEATREYL